MNQYTAIGLVSLAFTVACANQQSFSGKPNLKKAQGEVIQEDNSVARSLRPETESFVFDAKIKSKKDFTIQLDSEKLETSFSLKNIYSNKEDLSDQLSRTPRALIATQGNPGMAHSESFVPQAAKGLLDLLIVVDNSVSMRYEQANLSTKLGALLSSISNTDWRIAVTSTDPRVSCDLTIIKSSDSNVEEKFRQAITLGTRGFRKEMGIKKARDGLSCQSTPWIRNDSSIAVLIISDEDNCSVNSRDCSRDDWKNPSYLTSYIENNMGRTIGKDAGIYGIISDPEAPCRTARFPGAVYKSLFDYKSNGQKNFGDVCAADYSETLKLISQNIAKIITAQWDLAMTPDAGSLNLEIKLSGVTSPANPSDYTLQGKTITFKEGREPSENAEIIASYYTNSIPMFQKLDLSSKPAPGTLNVSVNGQDLKTSDFTLVNQELRFNEEPAANASISVSYREDTPLLTEFTVLGNPRDNQIQVYVNDILSDQYTYDAAMKKVRFNTAPNDGAVIRIAYENLDGPQLTYDLLIGGENPRDFKLFHGEEELDFERDEFSFTIEASSHEENRQLNLKYVADDLEIKEFPIADEILEGSLTIDGGDGGCSLDDGFMYDGSVLSSNCIVDEATDFKVSYEYVQVRNEFIIKSGQTIGEQRWSVSIDGYPAESFERNGNTLIIHDSLEDASKVSITIQTLD